MRGTRTASSRLRRAGLVRSRFAAAITIAVTVIVLSACSQDAPVAATTPARTASPAPSTVTAPPGVQLRPGGSAKENLSYFTTIVTRVWASDARGSARAYVDALSAAGFARADMQMTADTSTIGNPAESIQFSVRWGASDCLVGQVGPSTGNPDTAVLPQLAGGRCLIGDTPPVAG